MASDATWKRLLPLFYVRIDANALVTTMDKLGYDKPTDAMWVNLGLKRRDRVEATEWDPPDFGPTAKTKSGSGSSPPRSEK